MFKTIFDIMGWAKQYKKRIYLGFVCSFFSSIFSALPIMVAAYCLSNVVENTRNDFDETLIWKSFVVIAALVIFRYLFSYLRAKLQESIGYELSAEKRIGIGNLLKRVPLGYFQQNSTGDILSTVTTELSTLEYQGMRMVNVVVNGYINVLVILISLSIFSFTAALIALSGVLLSLIFLYGIGYESKKNTAVNTKAIEDMAGSIIEYTRGLSIVKSFGMEGVSIAGMKKACRDSKNINIKIEKSFTPFNCLHQLSLKIASVLLVLYTGWMTYQGTMNISVFIIFCLFSFSIFASIESINDSAHLLGVISVAMKKLRKIEKTSFIDEKGEDLPISNYNIRFKNVSFGYEKREILHDVSFFLPEGTTTAIVGKSGCGKSTICNLMARFYDVNSGSVEIGGIDIKRLTCDSLLKNISMVFQNVYLFHDTILNNIKFGNPNASYEEIIEAAKKARCHDFIMELPNGYDSIVGEGGSSLSGGEKQRISIARAILKNAPIIILDEATASVDPENEHLIQLALNELTHGKTIISIAHRLATIENADRILVVDEGEVVEQGTHEDLLKRNGIYRDFIALREKAEGWNIE